MVSYVVGEIRHIKLTDGIILHKQIDVLQPLMEEADCIDKDVITEIIDLGTNHVNDYDSAEIVARLSEFMLCQELNDEEGIESDTRIAFAIRHGFIEMCLNFVERFGGYEAFGGDNEDAKNSLFDNIHVIFDLVHCASLHKKTWKAIRHKMVDVGEKILHSKEIIDSTNNRKGNELLGMVVSILDMNGSYCYRCNESLTKTEVKLCNGCGRMSYCSAACQRYDWLNGHSVTCCKTYTDETAGRFQGRVVPESMPDDERVASKLKELEINMNMIHLKLFLDHSETIVAQAKGLGIPFYDCVAVFNLSQCPTTIEVIRSTRIGLIHQRNKVGSKSLDRKRTSLVFTIHNSSMESWTRMATFHVFFSSDCFPMSGL